MYNRYIPEDVSYTPVERPPTPSPPPRAPQRGQPLRLPDFLTGKDGLASLLGGKEEGGLSGALKNLHLDSGDILLLLIMLYLLVEGEDIDLAIALGLTLLMGLGEE
ncbi:hypothetical protein D1646_00580 [Pseudoflavonifractor sp. 60]|uniref:hypothetical protein n=1 Tax=Pseudoflavonifractor sp. 60 TaxID=2304576 RepID=UPI00136AEAC0|nr:hypothetical protein [Pseudoflavonifractor sp. 60]NBI65324.1 hypothetical protein [Pseudoflavonifractor sp. 60]